MPHTSFSKDDFIAFRDNDRPGPVHVLNLIRLRERAEYQYRIRIDKHVMYEEPSFGI